MRSRWPKLFAQWQSAPQSVTFPDGENLDSVRLRAFALLQELAREFAGDSILVVSHRVVLKVLLCAALALDNSHFWRVRVDVGSLSALEWSADGFTVVFINDTSHLLLLDQRVGLTDF